MNCFCKNNVGLTKTKMPFRKREKNAGNWVGHPRQERDEISIINVGIVFENKKLLCTVSVQASGIMGL